MHHEPVVLHFSQAVQKRTEWLEKPQIKIVVRVLIEPFVGKKVLIEPDVAKRVLLEPIACPALTRWFIFRDSEKSDQPFLQLPSSKLEPFVIGAFQPYIRNLTRHTFCLYAK
ncbi:hypothetical protein HMPREF9069_00971 [Atopobium sp. oral taxon 810 str. F0209]|nr:hypothetical protein HMPREF9069_00971 [Atopobium sp. oral taxon 810 str. F0209]